MLENKTGIVLTCIDGRVKPQKLDIYPSETYRIIRNAGAQLTPETLQTLAASIKLLDTKWLTIIKHADCRMSQLKTANS